MSLTTEQKINLLILAGFEPLVTSMDGSSPRMRSGPWFLWQSRGEWKVTRADVHKDNNKDFVPAPWENMCLDRCPDELIYQATGG